MSAWFQKTWLGVATWEYVILSLCLLLIPLSIDRTGILHDEPDWIHQSRSLELFLSGDFSNSYWDIQHDTLTQPPLARYIIGVGRWLGGYNAEDLTSLERFYQGDPTYTIDAGLIRWSRYPIVVLAVLTTLILFWVIRRYMGRLTAFAFLGLFLLNPSMVGWLIVAQSEMPLMFFVVLAILPCLAALESWRRVTIGVDTEIGQLNQVVFWLVMVGLVGGLAASAKLNGFAATLAASSLGVLLPLLDRRPLSTRVRLVFAIRATVLPILAGLLVMIALNPFLYTDPIGRIGKMLVYRTYEMNWQANTWPENRVPGGWERIPFMIRRVFQDYSALRFPLAWMLNISLYILGLSRLLSTAWIWLRGSGGSAASVVLLLVGGWVSFPMFLSTVDWHRYYLFPVVFSSIIITVGCVILISWLRKQIVRPRVVERSVSV